jgi:hypothetical protein
VLTETCTQNSSEEIKSTIERIYKVLPSPLLACLRITSLTTYSGSVTCLYQNIRRNHREAKADWSEHKEQQAKRRRVRFHIDTTEPVRTCSPLEFSVPDTSAQDFEDSETTRQNVLQPLHFETDNEDSETSLSDSSHIDIAAGLRNI